MTKYIIEDLNRGGWVQWCSINGWRIIKHKDYAHRFDSHAEARKCIQVEFKNHGSALAIREIEVYEEYLKRGVDFQI